MEFHPIIQRELRLATRKKHAATYRLILAGVASAITFFFLLYITSHPEKIRTAGRTHFELMFILGCSIAVIQPFQFAFDRLSAERRNKTLGLLFLAGLTGMEVFLCKMGSSILIVLSHLLAVIPFIVFSYLMGGISLHLLAGCFCLFPTVMFFVLAAVLAASSLCEDESMAMVLAVIFVGCFCAWTPISAYVYQLFTDQTLPGGWKVFNPAHSVILAHKGLLWGGALAGFWKCILITWIYSAALFCFAGWQLQKSWREGLDSSKGRRLLKYLAGFFVMDRKQRSHLGRVWLDQDPMVWRIAIQGHFLRLAWLIMSLIAILWLVGFWKWNVAWINTLNVLGFAVLFDAAVLVLVVFAAARCVADDRQSGIYETLLTSTLSVDELVNGVGRGVLIQFRRVLVVLACINLALFIAGLAARRWSPSAITTYLLLWMVVAIFVPLLFRSYRWEVIWVSLNTGRPAYAVVMPVSYLVAFLVMLPFRAGDWSGYANVFPTGSTVELAVAGFMSGLAVFLTPFVRKDKERIAEIKREFRAIAREPVPEVLDPGSKRWNTFGRPGFGKG